MFLSHAASGSGKTSLFSVLTGRIKTKGRMFIEHDIRLDGVQIYPDKDVRVRNNFALVSQEDSLHSPSTPRESFRFSAKLRLSKSTSNRTIENLVEALIKELGLCRCADSVIGGGLRQGISGGEKRRTSIGVELVARPSIVFLDEPTSGLDSFAAKQVMKLLKKVADSGNTVVFTIHQPSSHVFTSFDHLILLNQGRVMYTGSSRLFQEDFLDKNYPLPPKYNPADWMLDVAEENDVAALERAGFFPKAPESSAPKVGELAFPKSDHVSQCVEYRMLANREKISLLRNSAPMVINVVMAVFLALMVGVIFFRIGDGDRTNLLVSTRCTTLNPTISCVAHISNVPNCYCNGL